jgi:hypothetical protein
MFKHGWEPAEGTIIGRRIVAVVPNATGGLVLHEYTVDVRLADVDSFHAKVEQKDGQNPEIGDVVQLLVNPKNLKHVAFA